MKYTWYVLPELYTKEECDELVNLAHENKATFFEDVAADGKNLDCFVFNLNDALKTKMDKLFKASREINDLFFGLDVYWDKYTPRGNFNTYNVGDYYNYHIDSNEPGTYSDVKLTVVLNVSDEEYEGGDFVFFRGTEMPVEDFTGVGTLLIFPSFSFHKVTEITKGSRKTISFWLAGPHFK